MRLNVRSEIGRLRDVLVHTPGAEVDRMPPSMMAELLFDDILYTPGAELEHRRFRAVLEKLGVRVHDSEDLLREALDLAPDRIPGFLQELQALERLPNAVIAELRELDAARLADALVDGLLEREGETSADHLFRLPPLPNLLFTRDPQVVLAGGVVISAMSRRARQREPLLSRFVFRHHPEFATAPIYEDFLPSGAWSRPASATLEGGDVLVFFEGVLVVGVSERTMERAVDRLVGCLRQKDLFEHLILVPMPRARAAMHLDTIFTRVSADECLVYPPLLLPGGPETLSVIRIDLRREDDWGVRRPSLLQALREIDIRLDPIPCGGPDDPIRQAREQWTDGANSFVVRPGVVILYARNTATAGELARRGYELVPLSAVSFASDGRCLFEFDERKRYAVLIAGDELSRARGGPRCMTMPLVRDPL